MSDKKHIDRLFQEKLKDFEANPSDAVWENIHSSLHGEKRKKRRIIPIWWKLGGVAAILLLMLAIGNTVFDNNENNDSRNTVVDTEHNSNNDGLKNNSTDKNVSDEINLDSNNINLDSNNKVSDNETNSDETLNKTSSSGKNLINSSLNNQSKIASTKSDLSSKTFNKNSNQQKESSQNNISNIINKKKGVVADNSSNPFNSDKNSKTKPEENIVPDYLKSASKNAVASSDEKTEDSVNKEEETITNEKTIEDAIAETNTTEEKEKEEKLNRWNITPNVAPVYFNTFGKGSSIDEQFVENSKVGNVNMSYGITGSYALNDKLKIRAGVNKVELGYSTNNVISYTDLDATPSFSFSSSASHLKHVSVNHNAENTLYMSTETLNRNNIPEILNTKETGSLDQLFGFIEIPVEVEYALVNKKFGVNVIGGFSTLFTDKNEVYSVIDGNRMLIGEANNLNDVSYSANLGLGINYNVSDKIKLNLEPTFKYQINTFREASGDFQPYFIGVYTGLSIKF